jgi:hypothetical protein
MGDHACGQRLPAGALAAAGQDQSVIATARGQILDDVVDRFALLPVCLNPAPAGPKFTMTGGAKSLDEPNREGGAAPLRYSRPDGAGASSVWLRAVLRACLVAQLRLQN